MAGNISSDKLKWTILSIIDKKRHYNMEKISHKHKTHGHKSINNVTKIQIFQES